jgi:hypothetical protein
MKVTAFWDSVMCSLVEVDQCFKDAYCLHHQGDDEGTHSPDDEGSKYL